MNSVHGRDVEQLQNYIGHRCVASVKLLLLSFFRIYIWRSPLHYKTSVCCDVQCERRDLCALSEDIRYTHPNYSQIACYVFFSCLSLLCITRGPLQYDGNGKAIKIPHCYTYGGNGKAIKIPHCYTYGGNGIAITTPYCCEYNSADLRRVLNKHKDATLRL